MAVKACNQVVDKEVYHILVDHKGVLVDEDTLAFCDHESYTDQAIKVHHVVSMFVVDCNLVVVVVVEEVVQFFLHQVDKAIIVPDYLGLVNVNEAHQSIKIIKLKCRNDYY